MALTERQRDAMLSEIDKKITRILYLLDPPTDPPERTVKRDPQKLYGGRH